MSPSDEPPARRYWFRAKRYGWGWGMPTAWQGWVAYAVYIVLLVAVMSAFRPDYPWPAAGAFALSLLLVAVCWLKGEPPRWRWGRD